MTSVVQSLAHLWPSTQFVKCANDLPASPGAYLLELYSPEPLSLRVGRLGHFCFAPNVYFYAGSANGPGGLRARVSRHMRRDRKATRWHVDYLTAKMQVRAALVTQEGTECEFVGRLMEMDCCDVPVKGLGSSDCPACLSHFLSWGGGPKL